VVRLAHSDAEQLAEILKNLVSDENEDNKGNQNVKTSIHADASLNALVIRANPTTMNELKDIIASLDVRRLQVLIEAVIMEVSTNFTRELGTELAIVDQGSSNLPIAITQPSGVLASILQSIATNDPSSANLGTRPLLGGGNLDSSGTSFAFIIQAVSENSDVNLLSTPSITTMDNEEAKIVVGQNVPFRTGSTTTGSGGTVNPFTTIQREDVGLTLKVIPHVHDGNSIRLEIEQEVSEVDQTGTIDIGNDGSADLITNIRTIETTVLSENGEVVILGGLTRDKKSESERGVPLLKDIPLIGYLFKAESVRTEKQNLLVFIRSTVIASSSDMESQTTRKYDNVWEVVIEGTDPLDKLTDHFNGKR
jgi:general secretion pathway protein D